MKILLLVFTLATAGSLYSQEKAFQIYTSTGNKTTYKKMMTTLEKKDIVLFGEEHNNPIAHWLQLEFTKQVDKSRDIILGAEMFEADNQQALNDYLAGNRTAKELDSLARLWPNYPTDYAPLVDYAKENKLEFIATNIPRRDANLVFRKGFEALDTLSAEEKSWIAPLPIKFDAELPQYKNILVMMGEHGSPKLVMAQAMKDATMAHFILKNYKAGNLFIHYNGKYHSDFQEGILWYLQQAQPTLNYGTISTVSQVTIDKLEKENIGAADFIIVVDEDMTKTH